MHLIIHARQLRQPDNLERRLNQAPREEIDRLSRVLAVTHIRSLNRNHLDDRLEHRRLQVRTSGETNAHDGATRPHVLGSLLERLLADRDEDDGVRAQTIWRSGLHVLDDIARFSEVDKVLCAECAAHLGLFVARVDGEGAETHGFGVLDGERSETTSGTDDGDPLTGLCAGFFESLVHGDTGAEDGCDGVEGEILGYAGNMGGLTDAVFLEGAVDGVTRKEGLRAEGLVGLLAEVAGEAGAVEPLDTDVVANLEILSVGNSRVGYEVGIAYLDILDKVTAGYNDTGTFVATDKG